MWHSILYHLFLHHSRYNMRLFFLSGFAEVLVEGLITHPSIGQNNKSQSFFVGGTLGVGEGGCGTSPELIVLGVKMRMMEPWIDPVPSLCGSEKTLETHQEPTPLVQQE
ncbi:hypothetical protein Tco_0660874 [Tanacetum coccineum]